MTRPIATSPLEIPSSSPRLRIVSYNIHKGLGPANRRFVLDGIRTALAALDADIVLVQEVIGEHQRHRERFEAWPGGSQTRYLAEGTWPHCAYGANAFYPDGDHGNAILSRLPIRSWENIDLSINSWEQRGLLHAEVELPDGSPLHLGCLHLDLFEATRRRQIGLLCRRIEAAVPHDAPLVIGGDFNDWRGTATGRLRREVGLDEAFHALSRKHARTFPAWSPVLALDRIYVRNLRPVDARVVHGDRWRRMSDHLAIQVDVTA